MDSKNNKFQNLKTPEGKAKINKWLEEFIEKEKRRSEAIDKIMSNTNYIEWLIQFTKDKQGFSDDDWLYFPEQISDSDKKEVEKLRLLYDIIAEYASQNHINPTLHKFGNFYKIRLNDDGRKIGIMIGQGKIFYCQNILVDNNEEFIDFYDILNCKEKYKPKSLLKKIIKDNN